MKLYIWCGLTLVATAGAAGAADRVETLGLSARLKPMAQYVGQWNWDWRNEHGQSMHARAKVEADPSGAFLIDRTAEVQEGKLVPTELNIYFWQPQAKGIASMGFTSSGDHGSSRVFIHNDTWIEQSGGYDADGSFRTHIDRWHWTNQDQGVYQETHVVRAGRTEPDDFKLNFTRAQENAPAEPKAAEAPALADVLKSLARLTGHWKVEWSDGTGTVRTARSVVEPDAGGAVLTESLQEVQEEKVVSSEFTVFYWQAESKSVATVTLTSEGGVFWSTLYPRGDTWGAQASGYDAQGRLHAYMATRQWKGDDAVGVTKTNVFTEGQEKPDITVRSYRRVK